MVEVKISETPLLFDSSNFPYFVIDLFTVLFHWLFQEERKYREKQLRFYKRDLYLLS